MFEVKFGVNLLYPFSNKISRSFVLYSGHKESGLFRLSLSIGLWRAWMDMETVYKKAGKPCTTSLLSICLCSSLPGCSLCIRDFFFDRDTPNLIKFHSHLEV